MLKSAFAVIAAVGLLTATPAAAEVVARHADGFTLRFERATAAGTAAIVALMERPALWWDDAHTYSGDAANLTVDPRPGGCWCERLPDGSDFRHGTVLTIAQDQLVFDAPFGPMHGRTRRADLVVAWPEPDGAPSVAWTLTIEGPGLGALADPVDGVMGAAFGRFTARLEGGDAPAP